MKKEKLWYYKYYLGGIFFTVYAKLLFPSNIFYI